MKQVLWVLVIGFAVMSVLWWHERHFAELWRTRGAACMDATHCWPWLGTTDPDGDMDRCLEAVKKMNLPYAAQPQRKGATE